MMLEAATSSTAVSSQQALLIDQEPDVAASDDKVLSFATGNRSATTDTQSQGILCRRQNTRKVQLTIGAKWIGKVFRLQIRNSYRGWDFSLVQQNVRARDEAIFRAVKTGSVAEVKGLLLEGKASIHDVNEDGRSLIAVKRAVFFCSIYTDHVFRTRCYTIKTHL